MTRRRLTSEEIELWHKVIDKAERLNPASPAAPKPLPKPKPTKTPKARNAAAQKPAMAPAPSPRPRANVVSMDRKAYGRMTRGKLEPEGKIDLHGMTLERAHPALTRFILRAQASGKRLVLVITGKGSGHDDGRLYPTPRGILRRQVPHWLETPPLAQAVLQITPSHIRHGGEGAFYVYLCKPR
ncbi:Smr/MutS family protein [Arenibacterium sp. CAU 1754]